MATSGIDNDEPCYVISVAAKMVGMHQQTLRYYERAGIIEPSRSRGNIRLYSARDIERAQQIKRLVEDLGVNLAGVEVILNMKEQMDKMQIQVERLIDHVRREAQERHANSEGSTPWSSSTAGP